MCCNNTTVGWQVAQIIQFLKNFRALEHQHQSLIQTEDWAILVFGVNKLRVARVRVCVRIHYYNVFKEHE